jgi:hypothetical protein
MYVHCANIACALLTLLLTLLAQGRLPELTSLIGMRAADPSAGPYSGTPSRGAKVAARGHFPLVLLSQLNRV